MKIMKIMNRILITVLILTLPLASCYKDLGNYDYDDINDLEILGIDDNYYVDQGEELVIEPSFKGSLYDDEERFSFEWVFVEDVLSNEKDLGITVNFALGEKLCRFIVTDKETGVKKIRMFRLHVSSDTAGDLIVILSNYKGKAELSYLRLDRDSSRFNINYYQDRYHEDLGTVPHMMARNYYTFSTNSGFQVLTDEGLFCMDHNDMAPLDPRAWLDETFIMDYYPPYPQPDLAGYHVNFARHMVGSWRYNPYGGIVKSEKIDMVSGGNYYYFGLISYSKYIRVNLRSPHDGNLSPFVFREHIRPRTNPEPGDPDYRPGNTDKGFDISSEAIMFDRDNGRFVASNSGNTLYDLEDFNTYAGYDLVYGSPTSIGSVVDGDVYSYAVLSGEADTRFLLMEEGGSRVNHSMKGDVSVPLSIANSSSSFYTMNYAPYMYISTGTKLYRYNILDIASGAAPSNVIADLTEMGYDENAEIKSIFMSRTEQTLFLAVSRYGDDESGESDELKGDLLILDGDFESDYGLIEKYEGISGNPVDVMVKYKYFYRDGEDKDGVLMDLF